MNTELHEFAFIYLPFSFIFMLWSTVWQSCGWCMCSLVFSPMHSKGPQRGCSDLGTPPLPHLACRVCVCVLVGGISYRFFLRVEQVPSLTGNHSHFCLDRKSNPSRRLPLLHSILGHFTGTKRLRGHSCSGCGMWSHKRHSRLPSYAGSGNPKASEELVRVRAALDPWRGKCPFIKNQQLPPIVDSRCFVEFWVDYPHPSSPTTCPHVACWLTDPQGSLSPILLWEPAVRWNGWVLTVENPMSASDISSVGGSDG